MNDARKALIEAQDDLRDAKQPEPANGPSPEDARLLDEFRAAREKRGPRLKLDRKGKGGGVKITLDNSPVPTNRRMPALARSIGTDNPDFALGILRQTINVVNGNEADANFQLAAIQGIGPKDAVETLIATQLAALHALTMAAARRLTLADTLERQHAHEVALNKLSRTFAALVTTLKSWRSKGEQRVLVQHVHRRRRLAGHRRQRPYREQRPTGGCRN